MNAFYDFYDAAARPVCPVLVPIGPSDWEAELRERLQTEKARRELPVFYYRIHRHCIFPLPVQAGWEKSLPLQFENIDLYPWAIWLLWELRERWDTLLYGAVRCGDTEAKVLLLRELDTAFGWESYDIGMDANLGTSHFAMCVSRVLRSGIADEAASEHIRKQARSFLDRVFFPWLELFAVQDHSNTVAFLHNIRVITVFSGLTLAEECSHARTEEIRRVADEMLDAFRGSRHQAVSMTEMAAYDAFALDTVTEYWAGQTSPAACAAPYRDDLLDCVHTWADTAVPGRGDLLAPLGDVEPEMQFHGIVLYRLGRWLTCGEALDAFRRIPAQRLTARALLEALDWVPPAKKSRENSPLVRRTAGSTVLRTGWEAHDILCAVSTALWPAGHVHNDAGSFVLASAGRILVTDPGYQQYVNGAEREFTLDRYAHNAPVINGRMQTKHGCCVLSAADREVLLDLTDCYEDLPSDACVHRLLCLDEDSRTLTVTDCFEGLPDAVVEHSFTICPDFALTAEGCRARWTDGTVSAEMITDVPFARDAVRWRPGALGRQQFLHAQRLDGCSEKLVFTIFVQVRS